MAYATYSNSMPQFNFPTVPRMNAPMVNTQKQGQFSQYGDFSNLVPPPTDQFGSFSGGATDWGNKFLSKSLSMDPFGASGPYAGGFENFQANLNYPDLSNQRTQQLLSQYMQQLGGQRGAALNEAAGQFANAGVARGRGGFDVAGGAPGDIGAMMAALKTQAGLHDEDFKQSMEYMRNAALFKESGAVNVANLLERLIGTYAGTGKGMMDTSLQALMQQQAATQHERDAAREGYYRDVADRNRRMEMAPELAFQAKQRSAQLGEQDYARSQRQQGSDLYAGLLQQQGQYNTGNFLNQMSQNLRMRGLLGMNTEGRARVGPMIASESLDPNYLQAAQTYQSGPGFTTPRRPA